MADAFDVVRAGYDHVGRRYRDWSSSSAVRLDWVERLQSLLAPGSIVVDLGCGSGEPATRLLADRHRVIGVDASVAQLALAQIAAPSALLVQADMARFALRPASVDAVASFYALGHVPSHRHGDVIRAVGEWLRPGGVLLANAPVDAGDVIESDWLGVEMYFGGIGAEATKQAVADAGLQLETFSLVEEDEGDGHIVGFNWLVATRPREM